LKNKDQEIKNLLLLKKPQIKWEEVLTRDSNEGGEYNKILRKIIFCRSYREVEKAEGKNFISYDALVRRWNNYLKDNIKNYTGDLFYYPGFFKINKQEIYFSDNEALEFLKQLLDPNYKLRSDYISLSCYALALKKAFWVLSKEQKPDLELIFCLEELLTKIRYIAISLERQHILKQKERSTNKKISLSVTSARIDKIKKHKLYPEITAILDKHKTKNEVTPMDNMRISDLLLKIKKGASEKTLRKYRELIKKDFYKKNQDVK